MTSVPDQFCLGGHVAIVTGASSGPGAGFGRALAQVPGVARRAAPAGDSGRKSYG
jgi:NAD(P)-dependent dehydrogenase (short-subunit alcohol dehydrogenase family)